MALASQPRDCDPRVLAFLLLHARHFNMLNSVSCFSFVGFGEFAKESGRTVSTITHRKTISTCRAKLPMAEAPETNGAGF